MKTNRILTLAVLCLLTGGLYSCTKDKSVAEEAPKQEELSAATLAQIKAQGFSTEGARKTEGGYLVEGDILLTDENLAQKVESPNLVIAKEEQYRTTNLVTNLPQVITVSVTNLPQVYKDAAIIMINRYNALNLALTFQLATTGTTGRINIVGFYEGPSGGFITLGSAGFPSGGNPFNQIRMNTHPAAYGTNPNLNYLASVIQHEVGHCIGFRHTDYMNRAYSCGASGAGNEGTAGVGATHIPGTPTGPDANSWMLACSNGGNRTFNANDIIALNYLY
ncbi:protease [Pedobacter sp. KBW06]|uniref:M57 family metalloprotease n=1 Tax=Pedobacter sp. KBW06 TaxID=2153359 RepID=UPI000F599A6E|nr:M57 family metalloprotease [Pedobacter sp. KBW06]RQO70175.1 protease [Pedobacter sp. KBW06]